MLERYSRPVMRRLWSDKNKFSAWLKVELSACEAWHKLGVIPEADLLLLKEHAAFDVERIYELEATLKHDVIAFTRAVSESLGPEKKWIHYGLTSTDVVDTAYGYLYAQANKILEADLFNLLEVLARQAAAYKLQPMMGRTHGVHAEITSLGLLFALWFAELKRQIARFKAAADEIACGKISGAVGTYANIDPFVQDYVCEQLGINSSLISTQVLQRDRHAFYFSVLAGIANTLEKMATEIRHLQRTEVREVQEAFAQGQKGSSAMPHKRNPIACENICGCARVMRAYMLTANENVALWHQRDISHSAAERVISADATSMLDYMLVRLTKVIANLQIYPERMEYNINLTQGVIFSQQVMLALIAKGLSRETAYDTVQPLAQEAWDKKCDFASLLLQDDTVKQYLDETEISELMAPERHLSQVDAIYKRVGLDTYLAELGEIV